MLLLNVGFGTVIAAIIALIVLNQGYISPLIARLCHYSTTATSEAQTITTESLGTAEHLPPPPDAASIYQQLQGTWSLVSYEIKIRGPLTITRHPFGKNAKGLILYTPDGYMSAQLMGPDAKPFTSTNYHDGSANELAGAARNYLAYSGSYSIEAGVNSKLLLRHSVEVSLYPNWLGTDQSRICELTDTEMTLSPDTLPTWKGMKVEAVLKWRKLRPQLAPESAG